MCHPDRNRYLRFDGQAVLPNEPIFKIKKTALSDFHKSINDDLPMANIHNNEPNGNRQNSKPLIERLTVTTKYRILPVWKKYR
jgi:hypothetical protein